MAIAALIIVGVLLVSSTLIASLLVQRRAERAGQPRRAQAATATPAREEDEYSRAAEDGACARG